MTKEQLWIPEAIVDRRKHFGKTEYQIKWAGFDESKNTWEPITLAGHENKIAAYDAEWNAAYERNCAEELAKKAAKKAKPVEVPVPSEEDAQCSSSGEESEGDQQNTQCSKRKNRKARSELWTSGLVIAIKDKDGTTISAKCEVDIGDGKKCGTVINMPGCSTTPVWSHLLRKHASVYTALKNGIPV